MKIGILLYDNMTALDAIGPLEVLRLMPQAQVYTIARQPGLIRTDAGLTLFNAEYGLEQVTELDLLLIPGSSDNSHLLKDEDLMDWIRAIDASTRWTTSVCTGSLVLAAAGLLGGKRATTHWAALKQLQALGAEPVNHRVVREGKFMTAAGVSSGIDMALTLAGLEYGEQVAQGIQLAIEYDPQPPYQAGSVEKAPPGVVKMALARLQGRD